MSAEWMKIEDEYLNTLAHEKGIVTINDMEEREPQIYFSLYSATNPSKR